MKKSTLPYPLVPQLAKTDLAYASGDERLTPFFQHRPDMAAFPAIAAQKNISEAIRADLTLVLRKQYDRLPKHEKTEKQLDALSKQGAFTVVTAHQPSLLLGPLYFVYKALTAITLAAEIEKVHGLHVAPVFVLGSEDHDLEELNKAHLYGKQLVWQPGETGPVGAMRTERLQDVLDELRIILGESDAARQLFEKVADCYRGQRNFADATQSLLHAFFAEHGLLTLNMSDPILKRHFIPVMRAELTEKPAFRLVGATIAHLTDLGFKTQASPREINLFYMQPGLRERIVQEGDSYKVLNTSLVFSRDEILAELENHPERFSPNVVLRPLFQETILPNLAYVGGGGELAYWLERKSLFEHFSLPFPMLVRRHSALWLDRDAVKKLAKFGFDATEFFEDTETLVKHFIEKNAAGEVSLSAEIQTLQTLYEQIAEKAKIIDPTLEKAVLADAVKSTSALEQWQSRLVRAEKHKHETALNQLRALKEKLFPGGGLQERHDNFLPFILKYGPAFLDELKQAFRPFEPGFVILEED
jgi:bacillithiol biosynthesis cysteine-adding enzyme BshC